MSDAPARIWADPDHWIDHPPRRDADRPWEYAEYIRADLHRADALAAKDAEIAKLTAERDEALRRRDAWRARAENHVEIVNALRAKTAGKDSRTLSRALLGAAFVDAEARAEKAEAALAAKDAEIERLRSGGDDFDALIADARAEAEKAMRKFPQPNYVISKVAEEAGEVVKAAIHCAEGRETVENLRGEMKQLIAMIYRLWVEGDGVHGLPPARAALTGEKG